MRWKALTERAQFWIAAPIVVPMALIVAPAILFGVGLHWLLAKLFPRPSDEWHPWFAWRPVPLSHRSGHVGERGSWAWLQSVERRSQPYDWPTEYRLIGEQ